jgi:electron transfer flavoprotein beta subunit
MSKLRILVPIKRVLDYAIKPRIKKDQSGIDLSIIPSLFRRPSNSPLPLTEIPHRDPSPKPSQSLNLSPPLPPTYVPAGLKMSMNPFCELAVEQSLRLREGKVPSLPVEQIVAVSIGPAKTVDTLRTALAMGADKAIHVETDTDPEPLAVAKVLQKIAEREASNLVLLGKQSIDRDFGQTGQILGGLLNWAQVGSFFLNSRSLPKCRRGMRNEDRRDGVDIFEGC